MVYILLVFAISVAAGSLYYLQRGLRSLIAHRNILRAVQCIRTQKWSLLVAVTTDQSLKWRFYERPYVAVLAREVRKATSAEGTDRLSKELEDYLVTQYRCDGGLLSPNRATIAWLLGSLVFAAAIVLVIFAAAQIR